MKIRALTNQDREILEEYLAPHKAECMFICSNLKAAGIDYHGADFEGEYFGYFEMTDTQLERLLGVIVLYWNGNIMMHAGRQDVLENLTLHLKNTQRRPVAGILGPNSQAELVIKNLGLSHASFRMNRNEELYKINLDDLNEHNLPSSMKVVPAHAVNKDILIDWLKKYNIEALGALNDETLEKHVQEHWNVRLQNNDSWVLLFDKTPVALSAFNARLEEMVQVGPVWTPPAHRNKGYARLLLAYTLQQEKLKGIKQAILFTDHPAAIKAYLAIGFKKIGYYRLALLEKPLMLQKLEFTTSPRAKDIDVLTDHINEETPEYGIAHPFAFFIRDDKGKIIAGCNGSVIFGSIYTDQLWVHPRHRRNELGRQLMDAVHAYGLKSGCSLATITTMSFQQAKTFYETLGYVLDFERQGYAQNSSCLFMRKKL